MMIHLPRGIDPEPYLTLTREALDLPATIERGPEETRKDPLAIAALALSVPSAVLATWDLADRLGLLTRVSGWLNAIRGRAGGQDAVVELPGRSPRRLADLDAAEVLEAAKSGVPGDSPEDLEWDAFLIHPGQERATARRIWESLMLAGVRAYLDRASLRPGDDWPRRLAGAMARTRVFVVLVSASWANGWYTEDEVARAISLCRANPERRLIPVVLGREPLPAHELPYGLAHVQQVVIAEKDVRSGVAAVVALVRSLRAGSGAVDGRLGA